MPGPAGVPDTIRFVIEPEEGFYPFKGETEAPQAEGTSLGVAWVVQEAKSMEAPRPGCSCSSALSSALHLHKTLFFKCKVGL